jgi:hypothetical protein
MKNNVKTSVLIGILLGVMLFPMIMIPLMGAGVVIGAIYLIVHDVIMPTFQHHDHEPNG